MLLCLMLSLQKSTVFAQMYGFQGNARIFAESRKKSALGWSRYAPLFFLFFAFGPTPFFQGSDSETGASDARNRRGRFR